MAFVPIIEEVQRVACKASIMIEGLSGKGKSGLALEIAYALADKVWEDVGVIDTENKSINLFAGLPMASGGKFEKFKIGQLTSDIGFKPSNYLIYRDHFIAQGAKVIIEDSISHAWQYKGGVLDIVTKAQSNTKNQYAAWGNDEVVAEKNQLLPLIRDHRAHVITTVRVKEKHEIIDGKPVSLGEQQIQQADLKYEPDLVIHMVKAGKTKNGVVTYPSGRIIKSRYAIFDEDEIYEFTPDLLEQLKQYLADGIDPAVLLEQQRQDYIAAIKTHLDSTPSAKPIWEIMKQDAGHKGTKLVDIPLDVIKSLYINLTN